jgi:ABC-type lipopolysaccharide export system ATPase subunit
MVAQGLQKNLNAEGSSGVSLSGAKGKVVGLLEANGANRPPRS